MIYYVSTPTGERCLAECRRYGFREMSCPVKISRGVLMRRGLRRNLSHFALDNGAWLYHVAGIPTDFGPFTEALGELGRDADFVVVPDVVAGGAASLRLSEAWLPHVLRVTRLALLPVQDGMQPEDVAPLVGPRVGIFIGGSTPWKLSTASSWAFFAQDAGCYVHMGRVNTTKRATLCADLGIHSADGSSVARFSKTATRFKDAVRADRHAQIHLRLGA